MNEIELFLKNVMGDFCKKISPINNSRLSSISYYKSLYLYPTIQMVIISPLTYDTYRNYYILDESSFFYFFIYDLETDIIIGEITEIYFDEDWEEELSFNIYDAENRIDRYICPKCDFWLIQKYNKHGHRFISCSDYPECDFSRELDSLTS
jgi:hypothetical protein